MMYVMGLSLKINYYYYYYYYYLSLHYNKIFIHDALAIDTVQAYHIDQ